MHKIFTKHEIDKNILEFSKQFSMYKNHRKDITLQTMIIFEAFYVQANIVFFTSSCSFHVTVATFRCFICPLCGITQCLYSPHQMSYKLF